MPPDTKLLAASASALEVRRPHSENSSPFDSHSELSFDAVALTATTPKCKSCGAADLVDDPFRGHVYCANCDQPASGAL